MEVRVAQPCPPHRLRLFRLAFIGLFAAALQVASARAQDTFVMQFAQFGNGSGVTSQIVLNNPSSTAAATAKVEWFDDNGVPFRVGISNALQTSFEVALAPLGTVTISTDGQGLLTAGSARVTSSGPLSGVIRFSLPGIGIAGVGESLPLDGFITPVRRRRAGINTGVALRNVANQSVALTLSLQDKQGAPVAGGRATVSGVPAGGHLALFINELFPTADTDAFEGTLLVRSSGGRIAATVLELGTNPGEFTTLPVTPLQ